MLATPVAVLGGAEWALRAGGYGFEPQALFVVSPAQAGFLQANPLAIARLFADPAQAPGVSIETAYFRANKSPGAFRVFVQGESSAAGFPYGLGASLAGVLDQRLERAFPEREIEVISTAMAAVNTYALLEFADEIIAQQPDAIVIYVGHNEYLGILGVGSSFRRAASPWATRLALALRDVRLYQWVGNLIRRAAPAAPPVTVGAPDSLMARVAAEREIAFGSSLYEAGVNQFEHNLRQLLATYRAAKIPVFVGTLVSNERDQPPFVSVAAEGEQSAAAHFDRGRLRESARDYRAANEEYGAARDRDALRFRAPSAFNAVVRYTAAGQGAVLVDVEVALRAVAREGMLGDELLLEHVHPNLNGYFYLADAFFDAIVKQGVLPPPAVTVADAVARTEMPVSDLDRWLGEYKLLKIKSSWPFVAATVTPTLPPAASAAEQLAQQVYAGTLDWPTAQDQLRANYRAEGNAVEYARVSTILADAFPFVAPLQLDTADALAALGRVADARRYVRRALEVEPQNALALERLRSYDPARVIEGSAP
jgi:lysophospholipase L1-like esterase